MTISNEIGWNFDNSYARLPQTFFSKMKPNPVQSPELVIINERLAKSLGLNIDALTSEGIAVLSGSQVPVEAEPLAQAYAGHQFGHFNMLGDGRAMLIGEQITPEDKRVDIQLKGSGRTLFRAVEMDGRPWARCSGSTLSVKPCMDLEFPRPAVWRL